MFSTWKLPISKQSWKKPPPSQDKDFLSRVRLLVEEIRSSDNRSLLPQLGEEYSSLKKKLESFEKQRNALVLMMKTYQGQGDVKNAQMVDVQLEELEKDIVQFNSTVLEVEQVLHHFGVTETPTYGRVVFDFEALDEGQLSIHVGDIIEIVSMEGNEWWLGSFQGNVGYFPKNYVEIQPIKRNPLGKVRAKYSFEAQSENELSIQPSDLIQLLSADGDEWWKGELRGRVGYFPKLYVETEEMQSIPKNLKSASSDAASHSKVPINRTMRSQTTVERPALARANATTNVNKQYNTLRIHKNKVESQPRRRSVSSVDLEPVEVPVQSNLAQALFDFDARGETQLSLKAGDIIQLISTEHEDWWEGEVKGNTGFFPKLYVKLVDPQPKNTVSNLARAIFDFQATASNELSLHVGDQITLLSTEDDEWWQGELNGKVGFFPKDYVTPMNLSHPNAFKERERSSNHNNLQRKLGDTEKVQTIVAEPTKNETHRDTRLKDEVIPNDEIAQIPQAHQDVTPKVEVVQVLLTQSDAEVEIAQVPQETPVQQPEVQLVMEDSSQVKQEQNGHPKEQQTTETQLEGSSEHKPEQNGKEEVPKQKEKELESRIIVSQSAETSPPKISSAFQSIMSALLRIEDLLSSGTTTHPFPFPALPSLEEIVGSHRSELEAELRAQSSKIQQSIEEISIQFESYTSQQERTGKKIPAIG